MKTVNMVSVPFGYKSLAAPSQTFGTGTSPNKFNTAHKKIIHFTGRAETGGKRK